MSDTAADPASTSRADILVVACPTDAALNRVPRARLGHGAKCGKCGNPLFQGRAVDLDAATFERHVVRGDLPVVIDFWAEWCGPCRMMAPNFQAAVAKLEPRVRMAKLDTEAETAIAGRYAIRGIPTMIMIRKGREIARTSGVMPTAAIVQWVEQALARP
jgi:thioredoxin 2